MNRHPECTCSWSPCHHSNYGVQDALEADNKRLKAENERLTAELDCPFRLARHSKRLVEQLREENERLSKSVDSLIQMERATGNRAIEYAVKCDELSAEVSGLRTGYQAYERVNAELKAESERIERNRDMWKGQVERQAEELTSLRKDAERYRWLRDGAGYCDTRDIPGMAPARMDAFIDDNLGQGEQS